MLELRLAMPPDALAIAEVHVRSWQAGYRGLIADEILDAMRPEDRVGRYQLDEADVDAPSTIVAIDDEIVGFVTLGPSRNDDRRDAGEVLAIYVDPKAWGQGVGHRLIHAARDHLFGAGYPSAVLWTLDGNGRAERLYVHDGWARDGSHREEDIWGAHVAVNRYGRQLP